jgi:hypothetical protein
MVAGKDMVIPGIVANEYQKSLPQLASLPLIVNDNNPTFRWSFSPASVFDLVFPSHRHVQVMAAKVKGDVTGK